MGGKVTKKNLIFKGKRVIGFCFVFHGILFLIDGCNIFFNFFKIFTYNFLTILSFLNYFFFDLPVSQFIQFLPSLSELNNLVILK